MSSSNSLSPGRAVVTMLVATLAMVATLPARSVGLGLISGNLIEEFQISELEFTTYNLWATLVGASFVVLAGPALDRFGIRNTSVAVLGLFGGAVLWFSFLHKPTGILFYFSEQ